MHLLDNAKWRNGAIWTAVMMALVSYWEIGLQGVEPTPQWYVSRLMIWGAAGAGYAILTGWLATRRERAGAEGGTPAETPPQPRAARRAAERAARKAERRR